MNFHYFFFFLPYNTYYWSGYWTAFAIGMNATSKLQDNVINTFLKLLNFVIQPIIVGFVGFSFYWGLSFFSRVIKKIIFGDISQ